MLKPLKTESTITSAIVPTIIPPTEIAEMMLIMFCFFFETRYLRAINSGKFKILFIEIERIFQTDIEFRLRFNKFIDVVNIIETIVDIEFKFGNNAQWFTQFSSQFTS